MTSPRKTLDPNPNTTTVVGHVMSDGAKKTIFEGCIQVDSFGPDDEYEDGTEEEHYVTLDLGAVDPTMVPNSAEYRLIVSNLLEDILCVVDACTFRV